MTLTCVITSAAGFIGSHLADRLLMDNYRVIGLDSLSRGTRNNLTNALAHSNFFFHEIDLADINQYSQILKQIHSSYPIGVVWHLATNSDIHAVEAIEKAILEMLSK